jgi:outer membrane biosynthesis protein TonB
MVRSSHEYRNGWIASIIFHAIVAVMLMYIGVRQYIPEPNFVEMTWGVLTSTNVPIPEIPSTEEATRQSTETEGATESSMNLPNRKFLDLPDEVISVRDKKKNLAAENPVSSSRAGKLTAEEQRTSSVSSGFGTKENALGKSTSRSNVAVATPFGSAGESGGLGSNVAFSMQWAGGGNRKLLAGDVPTYPAGVNISAQIKLRVIVLPNGAVKSAAPAQKGETRLENAALAKVKLWKFEPLLAAQPQIEQICNITFNFTLK